MAPLVAAVCSQCVIVVLLFADVEAIHFYPNLWLAITEATYLPDFSWDAQDALWTWVEVFVSLDYQ
jgi:hypothetical protein